MARAQAAREAVDEGDDDRVERVRRPL